VVTGRYPDSTAGAHSCRRPIDIGTGTAGTAAGGLVFTQLTKNATALYGTIGGIFGFLAFLYATMWSLLLAAELSAVLMSRRQG
jgi:uncharacterized BrkB/YihY/UPF0761 family membrane protein